MTLKQDKKEKKLLRMHKDSKVYLAKTHKGEGI